MCYSIALLICALPGVKLGLYRDLMVNVTFFNSPTSLPDGVEVMAPSLDNEEMRGTFAVKGLAAWHLQRLNRPSATGVLDLI